MKLRTTGIPGVALLEPRVYADARGFFYESWNKRTLHELQIDADFVQDSHSRSVKGTLRGLHYQVQQVQGKLLRVIAGEVFDVVVDLRRSSPNFGKHVALRLNAETPQMLWVPPGFAHGFAVLTPYAEVLYKMTDYYAPQHERSLLWNDPALGIAWPLEGAPLLSAKDAAGIPLAHAETYAWQV